MASKEHNITAVRARCNKADYANKNGAACGNEFTTFIPATGSKIEKRQCPLCGQFTNLRDLEIIITYPPVPFGFEKMDK